MTAIAVNTETIKGFAIEYAMIARVEAIFFGVI